MNLIIKFTDQSESFTHGVEFGRLLEKMERGDGCISNNKFPVRDENKEVLKSACEHYGYIPIFSDSIVCGWSEFIGIKKVSSEN